MSSKNLKSKPSQKCHQKSSQNYEIKKLLKIKPKVELKKRLKKKL